MSKIRAAPTTLLSEKELLVPTRYNTEPVITKANRKKSLLPWGTKLWLSGHPACSLAIILIKLFCSKHGGVTRHHYASFQDK